MKGLAKQGVMSMSEMTGDDYTEFFHHRYSIFKELADAGEFTSRVHVFTSFMRRSDFAEALEWKREFDSPFFQLTGVKGFLDGVTSTYTGLLLEPYADRPDTSGICVPLADQESLDRCVASANAAGLPVRIHCIAEGSVRMALNAFEESNRINGDHGMRNAIEHIETVHPDDISRFAELGVVASMQAEHLPLDMNEKIKRMGEERCRYAWPFKSFVDSGAVLAFGTDFPVVPYNQFIGIHASIARENYDGTLAGVDNGEKLTLSQALKANTVNSAYVYGRDHELGTLEKGKLADVIVLDRNLFNSRVKDIKDTQVVMTVVNGKVVHESQQQDTV